MFLHSGQLITCCSLLAIITELLHQSLATRLSRRDTSLLSNFLTGPEMDIRGSHLDQGVEGNLNIQVAKTNAHDKKQKEVFTHYLFKPASTEAEQKMDGITLMEFHGLGGKALGVDQRTHMDDFLHYFVDQFWNREFEAQHVRFSDLVFEHYSWMQENSKSQNDLEFQERCRAWYEEFTKGNKDDKFIEQGNYGEDLRLNVIAISNQGDIKVAIKPFIDSKQLKTWRERYTDTVELDFSYLLTLYIDWATRKGIIQKKYYNLWEQGLHKEVLEKIKKQFQSLELDDYITVLNPGIVKYEQMMFKNFLKNSGGDFQKDFDGVPWQLGNLRDPMEHYKFLTSEKPYKTLAQDHRIITALEFHHVSSHIFSPQYKLTYPELLNKIIENQWLPAFGNYGSYWLPHLISSTLKNLVDEGRIPIKIDAMLKNGKSLHEIVKELEPEYSLTLNEVLELTHYDWTNQQKDAFKTYAINELGREENSKWCSDEVDELIKLWIGTSDPLASKVTLKPLVNKHLQVQPKEKKPLIQNSPNSIPTIKDLPKVSKNFKDESPIENPLPKDKIKNKHLQVQPKENNPLVKNSSNSIPTTTDLPKVSNNFKDESPIENPLPKDEIKFRERVQILWKRFRNSIHKIWEKIKKKFPTRGAKKSL